MDLPLNLLAEQSSRMYDVTLRLSLLISCLTALWELAKQLNEAGLIQPPKMGTGQDEHKWSSIPCELILTLQPKNEGAHKGCFIAATATNHIYCCFPHIMQLLA